MKNVRIFLAVVILIAASLLPSYPVQAAPPPLDRARTGAIAGNSAGAFHYYTLHHPGGGKAVTLRLQFGPWHPNNELGIGFNLYDAEGLAARGQKVEGQGTQLAVTVANDFPTDFTVQVHNYYPGYVLNYTLTPEGLAKAEAEVGETGEAGTVEQPGGLVSLAQGTVPGLRHGSFDYYTFHHPGGKPIWIKMIYEPNHWIIAHGVGFNVYSGADLAAQGQPLGLDYHIRWVKLEPAGPTTYLIQIYNYIPEILLAYRLSQTEQPVVP